MSATAGELEYLIRINNAQALAAMERFNATTEKMAAKINGLRTSAGDAGGATTSLFDKIAHLGTNIANTVAGVEGLRKVLTWLKGAQAAAAVSAQAAAVANTALATTTRTAGTAAKAGAVAVGLFGGAAGGAAIGVGVLMTAMAALLPVIAAVSLAVSGLGALSKGIGLANEAEVTAIAFKTLTGNAEQARSVLSMISQMAIETPFKEAELQGGARALLAARVPASMLKQELKALGNIASATNGDIGRLATVYAQVAGKGKLYAEELQQFVEQGAGELRQTLSETLGVTTAELMEMMQRGEVGFSALQKAIQRLAGDTGIWGGAMADQSQTNIGLLSSLSDNVNKVLTLLAKPITDGPLKAFLTEAVSISSTVSSVLASALAKGQLGETLKQALILGAKEGINAIIGLVQSIPKRLGGYLSQLGQMVKSALSGNLSAFAELKKQLGSFDLSKMLFDTTEQYDHFDKILSGDEPIGMKSKEEIAKAAKEEMAKAAQTGNQAGERTSKFWAENLDSTGDAADEGWFNEPIPGVPNSQPKGGAGTGGSGGGSGGSSKAGGAPAPAGPPPLPILPQTQAEWDAVSLLPPSIVPKLKKLPKTPEEAQRILSQLPPEMRPLPSVTADPEELARQQKTFKPIAIPPTAPAAPEVATATPGAEGGKADSGGTPVPPAASAPEVPAPAPPKAPPVRPEIPRVLAEAAEVGNKAEAKIQGYSWERQGGAADARNRAAQRLANARDRVAGVVRTVSPTAPAAAVQAAVTPGGKGGGSTATTTNSSSGPEGAVVTKLDEVKTELIRIRTE